MGAIIRRQNGFVNQYLGDAIMAIFPEHPADALKTTVDMQKELRNYNDKRNNLGRPPIRIGIGMHTGPLIMGILGDDKRLDAATISDTVNTASRIENLTKFYGANILLSADSLPHIQHKTSKVSKTLEVSASNDFQLRFLGPVLVKGKQEPIGLYECFDGDSSQQVAFKDQTLKRFQEAMDLYFAKAWRTNKLNNLC